VLVMCRALVAVASREYGICGSSESDVLALGGTDAGMCLLASMKQNEWFNAMFSEHQKCAGSLALLQPKVKAFVPQLKEAEAATSTPCETQLVLDGIKLLGECKVGLRPTQSDILEGLVKCLCKRLEESYMSELSCGKSVGASALAEMELYTSVVAEVLPESGQGSLKSAVVSCQQQAGMEARFAALAELCSTWLDNQAKASEDLLEGLAGVRTSGAVMSGMQPACANVTATIAAARSEMMRRLLQTTGSSDDGLSSDDLQVMAQYSEAVKMLGGFASGTRTPDSADLLAQVFSEQWSAFQSFADYKALGDTAGTRVAADKDLAKAKLVVSGHLRAQEAMRGHVGETPPRLNQILDSVAAMLTASSELEIPTQKEKLASAVKALEQFGVGVAVASWDSGFKGKTFEELLGHACGTFLIEAPDGLKQALARTKKELEAWKHVLTVYDNESEQQSADITLAMEKHYTEAVVLLTSGLCLVAVQKLGGQPLKLRRALKAQKDSLDDAAWQAVNILIRELVEEKINWQRAAKGSKKT